MKRGGRSDSIGTCSICGYHGPGPRHECAGGDGWRADVVSKKPRQLDCIECGAPMSKTTGDHAYGYDQGKKILLRDMTIWRCPCTIEEVEIPRVGPLHETIAQALSVLREPREKLVFFFQPGPKGIEDGAWGVCLLSSSARGLR